MILSAHAIFGAAVASLIPSHPVVGFSLGFFSHFALDAIPHKDYELISIDFGPDKKLPVINLIKKRFNLIRDIILVSFDAILGLILAFLFFYNPIYPLAFFLGAVGSLIPDLLNFLYLIFKHKSLNSFFNFHTNIIHSKIILKFNQIQGVILQFCTVIVLIAILYGIKIILV